MITDRQALRLALFLRGFNSRMNVRKKLIFDEATPEVFTIETAHGSPFTLGVNFHRVAMAPAGEAFQMGAQAAEKLRGTLEAYAKTPRVSCEVKVLE